MAVLGNGYVGTVTATCLAWLGNEVVGLEANTTKVERLASGELFFYEPGLSELLTETLRTGRLTFTSDPERALRGAEIAFLCVGTPEGPDGRPDLTHLEAAASTVAAHLSAGLVVVVKSTVPVGTCESLRGTVEESCREEAEFFVCSNPEFLREGSAINDFLYPDRIVLAGDAGGVERLLALYEPIIHQSFADGDGAGPPDVIVTDLASAQMIKYAANAFLATKISFANEIANLCEVTGADSREVLPAVGADKRIGRAFLNPGLGWGGSCFPKDLAGLRATAEEHNEATPLLDAAQIVNASRKTLMVRKMQEELGALPGRLVALLGLTFKPQTDDLRNAPAIELIRELLAAGAAVSAYDPIVKDNALLPADIHLAVDPYDAVRDADALVIATEWPDFQELDFRVMAGQMRGDLVLDARNALDPVRVSDAGLRVLGVGWRP